MRSMLRPPRLAGRARRAGCRGPTLGTVFWLSVGGCRSSTSLASNSATATTLAGLIFIGRASVLENRDEAERISSALLLVIEFSFPSFSSPRDRFMKPWIDLGPGAGVSRRRNRAFQVAIAGRRWLLWSAATMRVRSV